MSNPEPTPKKRSVDELVSMAKRRKKLTWRDKYRSGGELMTIGFSLNIVGGMAWAMMIAGRPADGGSFPPGALVAGLISLSGVSFLLAGIIRWAIEPLIDLADKRKQEDKKS